MPRATALVMVALLALAGCQGKPPAQAEGRDIVRPRLGFAIDVPQGWTFRDFYGDVVLEISPQASGTAAGTPSHRGLDRRLAVVDVVAIDREGIALEAWADQAVKESQEMQSDLEVVSRQARRLADGRDALEVVLRNPRNVQPLVQRMLLVMTDRRAYAVLATAPEPDLPAAEAAFKKCFDSFVTW